MGCCFWIELSCGKEFFEKFPFVYIFWFFTDIQNFGHFWYALSENMCFFQLWMMYHGQMNKIRQKTQKVKALFTLQEPRTAQNPKTEQAEQSWEKTEKYVGAWYRNWFDVKIISDQQIQRYRQLRLSHQHNWDQKLSLIKTKLWPLLSPRAANLFDTHICILSSK